MITIIEPATPKNNLFSVYELKDGKAYRCVQTGVLFIGNCYADVVAFAIDGEEVITNTSSFLFEEVNLRIEVSNV